MNAPNVALVLGASGVAGTHVVQYLERLEGWDVIAAARRPPPYASAAPFVPVDLRDPAACREKLGALGHVSHLIYAAYAAEGATWAEQTAPNAAMLVNAMDALEPAAPGLRHVTLLQGTKYYGNHLGPFRTPAKEGDPRHMPPNFYFDQEEALSERQPGKAWAWTLLRPHFVAGISLGKPMNLVTGVAVYCAISKKLGLPLRFPGPPEGFRTLSQATDADLLAKAAVWAGTEPACANQAFNITNGDFLRWENLWPLFAAYFGMEPGPVQEIRLADFMADKGPLWQDMVRTHGLAPYRLEDVVSWGFVDYVFRCAWDIMSDTTRSRRAGFDEYVDTEEMFVGLFDRLRAQRIIP